jgi:hypothetical protein
VKVTGNNGCAASDSLMVKIVTNCVDKDAGDVNVRYFPNPTNGDFTLVLSSAADEDVSIRINTIENKLVYTLEDVQVYGVKTINIDLKSVAQGTYILYLKSKTGELSNKLVIKK